MEFLWQVFPTQINETVFMLLKLVNVAFPLPQLSRPVD